jgi:Na+-driven multidrug efflux pump
MKDQNIIDTGSTMLRIVLCGMPFIGFSMVTTCIFQSTGKAAGALALSAGRQGYIYALVLILASTLFGYIGVVSAQPVADVLTAGLAFILYQKLIASELN